MMNDNIIVPQIGNQQHVIPVLVDTEQIVLATEDPVVIKIGIDTPDTTIVSINSDEDTLVSINDSQALVPVLGPQTTLIQGLNGLSAYELALQQGFEGTLDQWLASLKASFDSLSQSDKILLFGAISDAIRTASTAQWNVQPTYIPGKGQIIIYTDRTLFDGTCYPGFKVGDGKTFIVDLPFVGDDQLIDIRAHIANHGLHITQIQRERWNNKVTCYMDDDDPTNLVFSKQ